MMNTVIHQLKTEASVIDGMSYVIEAADGSLLVIDGGYDRGDAELLLDYLRKLTGLSQPVVDLWILTHAHPDHTFALKGMGERHSDEIRVKKLLFSRPEEEYFALREKGALKEMAALDAALSHFPDLEYLTPKRGDRLFFGDTEIEILLTHVDLPDWRETKYSINDTSTVFRVWDHGESVLFLGDAQPTADRVMLEIYGDLLKSDAVQLAHHGGIGSTEEFYRAVAPQFLFWPISKDRVEELSLCLPANRYLLSETDLKDVFYAAHGDLAVAFPLTPREKPFLPKPLPRYRALTADLKIPRAENVSDPLDPQAPFWDKAPVHSLEGFGRRPGKTPAKAWCRLAWTEEALLLRVDYAKEEIPSAPECISSLNSCCVRVSLSEEPITDYTVKWSSVVGESCFHNLKLYPEMKWIEGTLQPNTDPSRCASSFLSTEEGYRICARIPWSAPKKKGAMLSFDLEVSGNDAPGGRRSSQLFLKQGFNSPINVNYPAAALYLRLEE